MASAGGETNPGTMPHLCLKWNNYQMNLSNVFDQLLQSETFVDVTLAAEGQTVKAHKMVLSACSPYFQALFNENPCPHPIIILKDTKWVDLKAVVEYMYKGEISVAQNELSSLLKVADNLKIRGLSEMDTSSSPSPISSGVKKPESPSSTSPREERPASSPRPPKRRRSSGDQPSSTGPGSPMEDPEPSPGPFGSVTVTPVIPQPQWNQGRGDEGNLRPGIEEMIREEEKAKSMDSPNPNLMTNVPSPNPGMFSDSAVQWKSKAPAWTKEQLQEAIHAIVTQRMRFTQAAAFYNIPKGTLYDNILGKTKRMSILEEVPLDISEEDAILDFCCDVSVMPYNRRTNKTLDDIITFVERLKRKKDPYFAFHGLTGFRWWWAFCKKHNIVSLHYAKQKEPSSSSNNNNQPTNLSKDSHPNCPRDLKLNLSEFTWNNNNYEDAEPQNLSMK